MVLEKKLKFSFGVWTVYAVESDRCPAAEATMYAGPTPTTEMCAALW